MPPSHRPDRGPQKAGGGGSTPGRAAAAGGASVSLRDVHKRYGSLHVLDAISLEVGHHEIVTILGPSGCGKTTLLRIVDGLIPCDHGEVLFGKERVEGPRPQMAMVFQNFRLFPWKRLSQNVAYGLRLQRRTHDEINRIVRHYIELVGLAGFEERFPSELSGGMQQRAGLARALAAQPEVLLLDEPFGALDALTREQLQEELLNINEAEPRSMIFITHSIDEALLLGDRVVVMSPRPGRIRFELATGFGRRRRLEALRRGARFQALRHYIWEAIRNPTVDPGPVPEDAWVREEIHP